MELLQSETEFVWFLRGIQNVRWLRFSFKAMFFLTIVVAMLARIISIRREGQHAQAQIVSLMPELTRLRNIVGRLTINDPSEVAWISVPSELDDVQITRLYMPSTFHGTLKISTTPVIVPPASPVGSATWKWDDVKEFPFSNDGEDVVTIRIERKDGIPILLRVFNATTNVTCPLPDDAVTFLNATQDWSRSSSRSTNTQTISKSALAIVHQISFLEWMGYPVVRNPDGSSSSSNVPSQGIKVWLDLKAK